MKTLLEVTTESLANFRAEILLTATLRHPSIINFKGACWGATLTGLVLEWAPKGSMADLLATQDSNFRWDAPLLQFFADVSRGMLYLHEREYFDEVAQRRQRCVVHRDLKPENVLITEYDRAKVSDFGSSKALENGEKSAAGTPLYAAPEIMLGSSYGEQVDVYSFGMMLIHAAAPSGLAVFLGRRWLETHPHSLPSKPRHDESAAFNAIRAICTENWSPVTQQSPVLGAPSSINSLAAQCIARDPALRPSFATISSRLMGPCAAEVEGSMFVRSSVADMPKIGLSSSGIGI